MIDQEMAKIELKKYNQEHIIEQMEKLNNLEKKELLEQISQIDFEEITKLYKNIKTKKEINQTQITPIYYIDKEKINDTEKNRLQENGEQIIKNDQYAVVTMAGGQGTRLGFNGPKGTFKLNIDDNEKYIFEILAESLKK